MIRTSLARYLGLPRPRQAVRDVGPELHAQVRRLEIRARQAMEAGLAGQYQSAFRGRGLEFEEVRDYRRGDDVRTIDWNVTARTGQLHVKRFREERDLTVLLLVDLSASTLFGSGVMTVHDLIAEASSLFVLAAARRDRTGAILFDDSLRKVIPPRRGWRHGLRIVREVLSAAPGGRGTAVGQAVRAAGRILHRRGIVVLVVDQSCELPRRELLALASRHELVVARAGDPLLGRGFPAGMLPVVEPEGRTRGVMDGAPRPRRGRVPAGVDVVEMSTDAEYMPAVREMLKRRERRRVR